MFNQVDETLITTIVSKLNDAGYHIDGTLVRKAVENSPQLLSKIQDLIQQPGAKEKFAQIVSMLKQAAGETETTGSSGSTFK